MEEKTAIPIMDNMPEDVKQIVEYLNKNNISFDDYSGDEDNDEIELDDSFYEGSYIENDESDAEESSSVDVEENAEDAASLSDLDAMF